MPLMARGKQAAKAANRRAQAAAEKTDEVKSRLQQEREASEQRIKELEAEVRRLKDEHRAEAERLAAAEIRRLNGELEAAAELHEQLAQAVEAVMKSKEYLVFNACRYVSMKDGVPPYLSFARVATWLTEEPFTGAVKVEDFLTRVMLPPNGWTAQLLRASQNLSRLVERRATRVNDPVTISLDQVEKAEEPEDFGLHEKYEPLWYADRPPIPHFRRRGNGGSVVHQIVNGGG